jgi:hypothetical protein
MHSKNTNKKKERRRGEKGPCKISSHLHLKDNKTKLNIRNK